MLYDNRIDVSEGNDINKISASKKCEICCNWCFSNKWFKFQPNACNRGHGLLMMSMNLSLIAILNIKNAYCCCIIRGTSKNETINLLENIDLTSIKQKSLLSHIKICKEFLTFGDIEIEKYTFYQHKSLVYLRGIGIEKL